MAANSIVSGPVWPKFELVPRFYACTGYLKYKKDRIKNNRETVEISFPHYKSMGDFCCHGNQRFNPICPKTLCSLSSTLVILRIKFEQDWPTGFRDIQIWKCGRRTTTTDDGRTTDHWYTISSSCILRLRWAKYNPDNTLIGPVTFFMRGCQNVGLWW